jgi:molecular chaperone HtpG
LPPWAKFVRGVVDSADLQPTASRDQIQRTHPSFDFLQEQLGQLIIERLAYLAEFDVEKFTRINLWHHYHLKGMAFYHDGFFEKVCELLLFETSKGRMSLREYLGTNLAREGKGTKAPIYYFSYHGAATQFYRLAEARGWTVINAGQSFEEDLLKKYASRHQDEVHLERLDATDDPELFLRLDRDEEEKFRSLELDLEGQLFRSGIANVRVQMRRFSPADLPAVLIQTPETEAEEKLQQMITSMSLMNAMEDIAREALEQSKRRPQYLSLNADNPLVQKLLVQDRRNEMVREIMLGVYNSALLYSHNMLTQNHAEAIHEQLVRLFEMILNDRDTLVQHRENDDEMDVIG